MMLRTSPRSARRPSRRASPHALAWSHLGYRYRVSIWPECVFERMEGDRWVAVDPDEHALAGASVVLTPGTWRAYLEFIPAELREFVQGFRYGRLAALLVVVRCPNLLPLLRETPSLTPFLAAHAPLRGSQVAQWAELAAVHERSGVYGLLEWLGLPASRETLSALGNLIDADIPRRLLEPLRASLWDPATASLLRQAPALSDRQLARYCHSLAA